MLRGVLGETESVSEKDEADEAVMVGVSSAVADNGPEDEDAEEIETRELPLLVSSECLDCDLWSLLFARRRPIKRRFNTKIQVKIYEI